MSDYIGMFREAMEAGDAWREHKSELPKCPCCKRTIYENQAVEIIETRLATICAHISVIPGEKNPPMIKDAFGTISFP